ncbi:MAG: FGGY-family carbohydrate kinase [Phreatobacter sp.]|uniref:FGGY-family carbohydrate kinase n=1 Tax=Phreatobacter sp. TaxID=1966341 RepID=UPI004036AFEE
MACVLGLDIGTTSTIGILVRLPGEVLGIASRPVTLDSPHPGWSEENPADWWDNVCAITQELIRRSGIDPSEIKAVGTTGMLPAVVLLGEGGEILRPSIQQSDGRCGVEVEDLRREVDEASFIRRAGNGVNQQLVAAKLRWIEKHEPDVFRRIGTVFGSYDFINFRLTGERRIEQNWALEAGFVDITTHDLADDLIGLAHVARGAVPAKAASHEVIGAVTAEAARATGLAAGTPVVGGAADMIASAFAAGVKAPGDVLLKFGGSVDILVATDQVKPDPRLYLDYHLIPGLFMPNGCMSTGGSGLNWFARTFAGGERDAAAAAGITIHQHLDRLAAPRPAGAEGVTIVPYFLGEKTPIHDPDARGVIDGLTLSHDLGHLWRALLESYAYALLHHLEVLRDMGHEPRRFLASDGGAQSDLWMQIVADVIGAPVETLAGHPGSCLGAAWTAAVGVGLATDWAGVDRFVSPARRYAPDPATADVYRRGYARYRAIHQRLSETRR